MKSSRAPRKSKPPQPARTPRSAKGPASARPSSPAPIPASTATVPPPPATSQRPAEPSLNFALKLASLIKDSRCTDVILLDVKGLSPITDYLIIATGTSGRQMRSTADDAIELGKETDYRPLSSSGLNSETWICVDFVDVLLHLFSEDARAYYDLESLWGDAKRIELA